MTGSAMRLIETTVAPTMPVEAARIAPTNTTPMAIPPRSRPKSMPTVSRSISASPERCSTIPMNTKSGTDISVTLVMRA
jgi:hypothetical protein